MTLTVEQLEEHLHTEEEERPMVSIYLKQAEAYLKKFINRDLSELNENDMVIFDTAVLQIATGFYLNRDGSAKAVSKSYNSLNHIVDSIRRPGFGDYNE